MSKPAWGRNGAVSGADVLKAAAAKAPAETPSATPAVAEVTRPEQPAVANPTPAATAPEKAATAPAEKPKGKKAPAAATAPAAPAAAPEPAAKPVAAETPAPAAVAVETPAAPKAEAAPAPAPAKAAAPAPKATPAATTPAPAAPAAAPAVAVAPAPVPAPPAATVTLPADLAGLLSPGEFQFCYKAPPAAPPAPAAPASVASTAFAAAPAPVAQPVASPPASTQPQQQQTQRTQPPRLPPAHTNTTSVAPHIARNPPGVTSTRPFVQSAYSYDAAAYGMGAFPGAYPPYGAQFMRPQMPQGGAGGHHPGGPAAGGMQPFNPASAPYYPTAGRQTDYTNPAGAAGMYGGGWPQPDYRQPTVGRPGGAPQMQPRPGPGAAQSGWIPPYAQQRAPPTGAFYPQQAAGVATQQQRYGAPFAGGAAGQQPQVHVGHHQGGYDATGAGGAPAGAGHQSWSDMN